jgi:hypothetical protein
MKCRGQESPSAHAAGPASRGVWLAGCLSFSLLLLFALSAASKNFLSCSREVRNSRSLVALLIRALSIKLSWIANSVKPQEVTGKERL